MRNGIFSPKLVSLLCLVAVLLGLEGGIAPLSASQNVEPHAVHNQSGPNPATFEWLGRIGNGVMHEIALSPDGTVVAAATTEGVFLYDSETLTPLRSPLTDDSILNLSWAPNGERLALAGVHEPLQVWERIGDDQRTWRRLAIMQGQDDIWFWPLLWSPDGSKLASDQLAWNVETGEILTELEERSRFVGWLADSEQAVFIRDRQEEAVIWDFSTNQVGIVLEGADGVWSPELSPDGHYLAVLTNEADKLVVWELDANPMPHVEFDLNLGAAAVRFVWSPDGRYVAVSNEYSIVMAEVASGQQYPVLNNTDGRFSSVEWSPQSDTFIIKGETITQVWSVSDLEERYDLSEDFGRSGETIWSPDGELMVIVSGGGRVRIIDTDSGDVVQVLENESNGGAYLAWLLDGGAIVGKSGYGVYTWDAATGAVVAVVDNFGGYINHIEWSPNGRYLASTSTDNMLSIWDVDSGAEVYRYSGFDGPIAWSPVDEERIAVEIDDNVIDIIDPFTGEFLRELQGPMAFMRDMAWSPDGTRLAVVFDDGSNYVWEVDADDAPLIFSIPPLDYPDDTKDASLSVAWSPNGTKLLTPTGFCGLYVWDALTGSQVRQIERHEYGYYCLSEAIWSPDGSLIASSTHKQGGENTLMIWNADTFEEITLLESYASNLAWSADSRYIATGDLAIWDVAAETVVATLEMEQMWLNPGLRLDIDWSPDGSRFSATNGYYIWIWGNGE